MKKILSLLSMLMITVMAFATDYKGQLDYTVTTRTGDLTGPSNAQGVLKIEPYAGGKYTVTATGCDLSSIELGNWDEIICEGVEGTTDANGVTTIDVAPYAFRGSDNAELKNAKLFVKFKGDKAYATFEGTYNPNFYTNYKLKYTFGVDEGFDGGSTGGGETGGETSSIKDEKTFNEALYMQDQKVADATVVVKEMSDETINMSLKFGENEYTSTELTKGTDTKGRTTYTGKVANGTQTYDVAGVVYEKDNVARLYMTLKTSITTVVVGENPDAVTPEVTEVSNKTYTSNLRIFDGEEPVVENTEAQVNIIKYSDESYKVTLKNVNMLNKTQDLVFVGKALIEEAPTEATEPLTIIAKSTEFFGEEMSATFEITEVSAEEIKMGFVLNNTSLEYQGEFNYTEEETPEVYTSNLHIYDAAAPETDLFQADQAKVEFLATATGGFKLTLKDVTLNEKTQNLVFTGTLPTPQPGGQDPLAEEGETTPAEPAMVLNATADEATATFLGATSATAVFNVIMNDEAETENDAFALTFTITAGDKTLGGEFNYEKQDTPDEKYPVNFDKTAKSTHSSRALNSFSLQQTGKDKQTKSVKTSKAAYEDHTADEPFTVETGSELTASFDYTGEWMHSFVYIDFDNDGQFSYKEGKWDQTGTDLVAFSFYSLDSNPKNDASGYNSVGDELTGDARNTYVAPSFKAPAKAGEYRIRFKFDWNCILPGGSSSILSDGGGVWDATLKVVEPVVDGISTINAEVANGETQLFTVNGVKLNKLQKGLNIVRTADGKVKKVLVK